MGFGKCFKEFVVCFSTFSIYFFPPPEHKISALFTSAHREMIQILGGKHV